LRSRNMAEFFASETLATSKQKRRSRVWGRELFRQKEEKGGVCPGREDQRWERLWRLGGRDDFFLPEREKLGEKEKGLPVDWGKEEWRVKRKEVFLEMGNGSPLRLRGIEG